MQKTPVIKTKNLSKIYHVGNQTIRALDKVNIEIHKGEFVAIIGKSGSGKSTLMHLIGLLDTPTSGQMFLNNNEVSNLTETQLAKIRNKEIGFVFQSFNLLERTSAVENVTLPLQYANVPAVIQQKKAIESLTTVGLQERLYNKPNELSGGQKQRVAIARALINEPSIILADEPTGNLDSKTGTEIENLFINLNKQGKTIILVTHDDDLARIAARKIILSDGVVVSES